MSPARVFRLTVAYDGTEFHGWQKQPGLRTVQGELERAVAEALAVEQVAVNGAGRTDAGVHARGQVASFEAETTLPARAVSALAQRALPYDVRIVDAAEVGAGFHARHSARARRYAYRLLDEDDVLLGRFAWHPGTSVHGERLAECVRPLTGEHDFSAFEAAGQQPGSAGVPRDVRELDPMGIGLALDVEADHFLYHMVRNLVGTAIRAQRADDPARHVAAVLGSRDRARAGATSPAQGLCLERVSYDAGGEPNS